MATLIITVNGPFAFIDDTFWGQHCPGSITLMAPLCAHHKAGISSIEKYNQFILSQVNCKNHEQNGCKPHRYQLDIKIGSPNYDQWDTQSLLKASPQKPLDPADWRFWLTLPRPDKFEVVNPVGVQILKPLATESDALDFATGVRMTYSDWNGADIPILHEGTAAYDPKDKLKTPFVLRFAKDIDLAIIELEYMGPLRDDDEHEDAVDCFETLMNSLGLPWSVFVPATNRPGPEVSKLNDCKAPIAWVG